MQYKDINKGKNMTVKTRKMPPIVREKKEELDPNFLHLTYEELEEIVCGNNPRFKVLFDHIPLPEVGETGYNINLYMEKDGREYRQFHFIDTKTEKEYHLNYTYAPYGWEFPDNINDKPDDILFVDESVLKEKPSVFNIKFIKEKEFSLIGKQAKMLMRQYSKMTPKQKFNIETTDIPYKRLNEVRDSFKKLEKSGSYSFYDLQLLIIPVCLEYKIESGELWRWVRDSKKNLKIRKPAIKTESNKKIIKLSQQLIESLIEQHSISSYEDFTCPIIRNIAKELNVFKKTNKV